MSVENLSRFLHEDALRLLEHDYRGIRLGIGAENDTVSEDNL